MDKKAKIYVAGHRGLVGSALVRELNKAGYDNLILKTHKEVNLENQQEVEELFEKEKPDYVFLAAAKVGGIGANAKYPAEFIYQNVMIETNIMHQSYKNQVKKLLFLGSSCIYPKMTKQPIKEEALLTGELEETNEAYAIAKIMGIKMCQAYNRQYGTKYIAVMPTNLYGKNDNFELETSHVLPALIRKIHEAKEKKEETVEIWGTGKAIREFMYVDDLAEACVYLMNTYEEEKMVNIGTGIGITIKELAESIKKVIGYEGELEFNPMKPDGTPVKINDVGYLGSLGWKAKVELMDGIQRTYEWYKGKVS